MEHSTWTDVAEHVILRLDSVHPVSVQQHAEILTRLAVRDSGMPRARLPVTGVAK